jgi:hypothetical protein
MATNQTGIAIVIKAWLPAGKTLDEQFNALSLVKTAHETGDYAPVLAAAKIDEVKAEQKTRRVEDEPVSEAGDDPDFAEVDGGDPLDQPASAAADADVPEFLKKDKKSKAA